LYTVSLVYSGQQRFKAMTRISTP